ncbi:MAG: hypothetical protein IJA75_09095 [Oscillospiraceae bacterium]|nr:hypothetical protein [Oscillospiraceae bacterium]
MPTETNVMEYKCPCCDAALIFGDDTQQMTCEYCGNTFAIEAVKAYNESNQQTEETFDWEEIQTQSWSDSEAETMRAFQCPSCGGEIITDEHTAATFCPFCDNPTIMPSRVSGGLKPDGVIPFKTGKEDAKAAFLKLCKGKPLLPKFFTEEQRLEKITGVYVPFWLYDCSGQFHGSYKATRVHHWSDAHYNYTRTEHFLLNRSAEADFCGIPMDGSTKMEDTFMESIEPYDYSQVVDFDTAFLSGFLADKYDVESRAGEPRIRQRVDNAMEDLIQPTLAGFSTVLPTRRTVNVSHSKVRYVLMPVWILNTRYRDKLYTFAMNGQTGKMTGTLPICPKRTAFWFFGLTAAFSAISALLMLLF